MGIQDKRAQAKFNLPVELIDRLAKDVPLGSRSSFVARAIDNALQEGARRRALEQLETMPRYPTNGEDSVEVLRRIRQQMQAHAIEKATSSE